MRPRRNWTAIAGLVLGVVGVIGYFFLITVYDASLHRTLLDRPLLNMAVVAVGLVLSLIGVRRAFQRTHGGRVLAPILAALNFGFAGLFGYFLISTIERLPDDLRAPVVGSPAPDFALSDQQGREVRLSGLRGRPVVLVFYRGHW